MLLILSVCVSKEYVATNEKCCFQCCYETFVPYLPYNNSANFKDGDFGNSDYGEKAKKDFKNTEKKGKHLKAKSATIIFLSVMVD